MIRSNSIKGKCESKSFEQIINQYKDKKIFGDFYPYQLMNKLSCYFATHVELASQINSEITELKTLAEGVQGTVYSAVFKQLRDSIVLKHTKKGNSDELTANKFFVALACSNKLRESIPNFVYIYGTFHCADPKLEKGLVKFDNWCVQDEKKNTVFLIMEKINGKTMGDSIRNCNIEQYLSYLLQIIGALQIAEESCSFTHYDLHTSNVILRPYILPYFYIKYKEIYIKTDKIATIIDYGRASIKVNGKWYGIVNKSLEKKAGHHYDRMSFDYDLLSFRW